MKEVRGIFLPDDDEHFETMLGVSPVVRGKATYQYRKYQAALPHVKGRGHAVDIGAHVGLWSRVMAMDFDRVTSFEPLPAHLECFARNCEGLDNVDLHAVALSSRKDELRIAPTGENSGNAHVGDEGLLIEACTLDSFRLTGIDLIKIDVEGYEYQVALGARHTIRREKPAVIVEQKPGHSERFGRGRFDALELLKEWGGRVQWEIGGDFLVLFQ